MKSKIANSVLNIAVDKRGHAHGSQQTNVDAHLCRRCRFRCEPKQVIRSSQKCRQLAHQGDFVGPRLSRPVLVRAQQQRWLDMEDVGMLFGYVIAGVIPQWHSISITRQVFADPPTVCN
jgi:hypothetical protein